jgi:hypothetical protein
MRRQVTALLALAALSGCYTVRFHRHIEPEPSPRYEQWHHELFDGLWEASGPIQLDDVCPNGIAIVDSRVTATNALASIVVNALSSAAVSQAPVGPVYRIVGAGILTGGQALSAWNPITVRITCAKGPEAARGGSAKGRKIAVLKLNAKAGLSQETADLYTEALVGELRREGASVLSDSDMVAMLGVEKKKAPRLRRRRVPRRDRRGAGRGADRPRHGRARRRLARGVPLLRRSQAGTGGDERLGTPRRRLRRGLLRRGAALGGPAPARASLSLIGIGSVRGQPFAHPRPPGARPKRFAAGSA